VSVSKQNSRVSTIANVRATGAMLLGAVDVPPSGAAVGAMMS
jgi:hypothetical protein